MRLEPARPMVVDPPVAASTTLIAKLVLRHIDWLCGSAALTCSARSGLPAGTAQRARRMRRESPCPAPLPHAGEGWGEGVRMPPRLCFS